ncbi:MAG: hypothetical protein H6651_11180 [Ardenticatenales bacterium]|nr:hypothetical protein [Ardenticatenales bacterium]
MKTGDVVQSNVSYPLPAILAGSFIELFLQVDPLALTAQPAYTAIDNGPMTDLGPAITIPASWLAEPNALAVGTIGTAGTTGTNFTATWVEIGIHPTTLAGTGSWVTLPSSVPNVRHEDAYIEHNGLFYLFGGRGAGTVNIYNPVTDIAGALARRRRHRNAPYAAGGLRRPDLRPGRHDRPVSERGAGVPCLHLRSI